MISSQITKKTPVLEYLLCLIAIVAMAIVLRRYLFISPDDSWQLHIAQRWLAGGNYRDNFFDVNPPMAIYIYLPAILAMKVFGIGYITSCISYVMLTAALSLGLCWFLFAKIFSNANSKLLYINLLVVAFIYVILPLYEFGEREHFMVMLVLPYLLLVAMRCEKQTITLPWQILVGLLGGIGFVIKPYFLLVWCAVEIYVAIKQRRWFAWLQFPSVLVIAVTLLYLASIYFFTPAYLYTVLPYAHDLYYSTFANSLMNMLLFSDSQWLLFCIICYLPVRNYLVHKALADILCIATVVSLLVAIIQRTFWYYHFLPAYSFVILLMTIFINEMAITKPKSSEYGSAAEATWRGVYSLIALMFIMIFAFKTYDSFVYRNIASKANLINLIKHKAKNKQVYFFSGYIDSAFPVIDYAQVDSASRFPGLWMLFQITKREANPSAYPMLTKEKLFLSNAIMIDLLRHQPELIFIVTAESELINNDRYINYLALISQDERWAKFWQQYSYLETTDGYEVYQKHSAAINGQK